MENVLICRLCDWRQEVTGVRGTKEVDPVAAIESLVRVQVADWKNGSFLQGVRYMFNFHVRHVSGNTS